MNSWIINLIKNYPREELKIGSCTKQANRRLSFEYGVKALKNLAKKNCKK